MMYNKLFEIKPRCKKHTINSFRMNFNVVCREKSQKIILYFACAGACCCVVCPIELLTFQVKGIQKLYNNVLYVHTHNTTGNRVSNAEYIL